VLVAFGDKIAFEDTLDDALDVLFGGDSGATAGDKGAGSSSDTGQSGDTGSSGGASEGSGSSNGSSPSQNTDEQKLQAALQAAQQDLADREAALKKGDWAAYGDADAKLQKDIAAAQAASDAISKDTSSTKSK
jgi:uncharacterized membrane protein (UPF0182 family)